LTAISRGLPASVFTLRVCLAAMLIASGGCASAPPAGEARSNVRVERALRADLDRVFEASLTKHALWGVEVKSLDTGRVWYSRNAGTLMMPASNMKIVTLAAAAETLGWDYRFKTTLETSAAIEDGTLNGDLIVVGHGDPSINNRMNRASLVLDQWAAALKAAGINRIEGHVIGDAGAFDGRRLGQGWAWDYLQEGYAAPVGALEFDENIATLSVRPGAQPGDDAVLELPPGTGLGLLHHATTGEPGSPTTIDVERPSGGNWLDVTGAIAADAKPLTRNVAVANPTLYFAHSLVRGLIARGIEIRGLPVDLQERRDTRPVHSEPRRVIVETESPPLRDIATVMMKVSQNLYAETLLKAVGAATSGLGTTENGRVAARQIFTGWNVPTTYVQADGSGLSRYDYLTAEMLVAILQHLHGDPRHRDDFLATLPVAGKDGTISTRLRATRAEANAAAKTGSIANVRALSGYVRTRDGETLAFSILANNFTIPAATINWMADLAVETLANYSRR
jgi:D-alanyl-D-alanine carboxypeptidase/D-alanyl-D-alanine-endopeptidase (penicillin-binding protein 4)